MKQKSIERPWYVPHTTRNILWYDLETTRIKIATHARFDEGMNDLPVVDMPPNVRHLVCADDGEPIAPDPVELSASTFAFDVVPFVPLHHGWLKRSSSTSDKTFGFSFANDTTQHRAFVSDMRKKSAASALCSSYQATRKKLLGAFVLEINHDRAFSAADAVRILADMHNQGVEDDIPITFALEPKLKASDVRKRINEAGLFAPNTKWDENENVADDVNFMDRAANKTAHINNMHAQIRQHLCTIEDDMEISVPTLDIHSL